MPSVKKIVVEVNGSEIETEGPVYVRLLSDSVASTIPMDAGAASVNLDWNDNGELVGVEIV